VAPAIFDGFWEYQVGLVGTCVLLAVCSDLDRVGSRFALVRDLAWATGIGALFFYFVVAIRDDQEEMIAATWNFYGLLRVYDKVIRLVDVDRVDGIHVGEPDQIDNARRLRSCLRQVLVVEHNIATALELVPLRHFGLVDLAVATGASPFLLKARLALAVELVKADSRRRVGGRKHPNRHRHEADLHVALPGRTYSHGVVSCS
jgi:hypothetical protein